MILNEARALCTIKDMHIWSQPWKLSGLGTEEASMDNSNSGIHWHVAYYCYICALTVTNRTVARIPRKIWSQDSASLWQLQSRTIYFNISLMNQIKTTGCALLVLFCLPPSLSGIRNTFFPPNYPMESTNSRSPARNHHHGHRAAPQYSKSQTTRLN